MKRIVKMKKLAMILLAALMLFGAAFECSAASKVTDLKNYKFANNSHVTAATMRAIASRAGFKRYYVGTFDLSYKNRLCKIGYARNARYGSKRPYYTLAANNGSKNFRFYNVIIGDSKALVKKKLRNTQYRFSGSYKYWGNGMYDMFQTKFKNGKLVSWRYYCMPTS